MLYLIKDRDYIKIGYTSDMESRLKHYDTHNVYYELLDVVPGTEQDERDIHSKLKEYNYKLEWYYSNNITLNCLSEYKEKYTEDFIINKLKEVVESTSKEIDEVFDKNGKWSSLIRNTKRLDNFLEDFKYLNICSEEFDKYYNLYKNQNRLIKTLANNHREKLLTDIFYDFNKAIKREIVETEDGFYDEILTRTVKKETPKQKTNFEM